MRILFIEDDAHDAELTIRALRRSAPRFQLDWVTTLAAARGKLTTELGDLYDLVLSDLHLPDGTGIELLTELRGRSLDIPFVLVTGATDPGTALRALHAGADDYVPKGMKHLSGLARVLELALGRHQQSVENRRRKLRILYAEHRTDEAERARRHFAAAAPHLHLTIASNRASVLSHFCDPLHQTATDVLVFDSELQGASAIELVKELRQDRGLALPIILLTGQGGEDIALQCMRLGATDYVHKHGAYLERLPAVLENAWYRLRMSRLAAFAEHSPNPVFELTPEAAVSYCNAAATDLATQLKLHHTHDMLPPDAAERVRECLRTGNPVRAPDTTQANRLLSWLYCPVVSQSVVHCYADDVTERHELEERLRHSQKMEAVGQLAGGVAHDFNNLLTVIEGNIDLIRTARGDSDELHEIRLAVQRAAGLTRQLLTFGRRGPLTRVRLDLNDVVVQTTQMLGRLLGEHVAVELETATGLPMIWADRSMVEQVVMNLALNARDAMAASGGILRLATRHREVSEQEAQRSTQGKAGSFAVLTVTDTGSGIAEENLCRIFEPFFTTKDVGKGTGLGLSTVQGILQQHAGWVHVESTPGHGSTFSVYFPELVGEPFAVEPGPQDEGESAGTETILLVEDEAAVRLVVGRALKQRGYHVLFASNAEEAMAQFESASAQVDLLLTDLIMPGGVNGRELAQRLRSARPQLPVVFTSGYQAQLMSGSDEGNAENFLSKPYVMSELYRVLRTALAS